MRASKASPERLSRDRLGEEADGAAALASRSSVRVRDRVHWDVARLGMALQVIQHGGALDGGHLHVEDHRVRHELVGQREPDVPAHGEQALEAAAR